MSLRVTDPELFGVTESSLSLFFCVEDGSGPVDAEARILLDGETRAISEGLGTRSVRIDGLEPDVEYRLEIAVEGAPPVCSDRYFPSSIRTHAAPSGAPTATFATLNDLHFGEPRFGGQLTDDHEYGEEASGFPLVRDAPVRAGIPDACTKRAPRSTNPKRVALCRRVVPCLEPARRRLLPDSAATHEATDHAGSVGAPGRASRRSRRSSRRSRPRPVRP